MAYVDRVYVENIAPIQNGIIGQLESSQPGAFDAIAEAISRMFDARLHKRYATPFDETAPPEALKFYVAQVVAYQVWLKVGFGPQSEQDQWVKEARDSALEWLRDAADSVAGTTELPIREQPADGDKSGISRSRLLARNDASPYTWVARQAARARNERS